MRRSTRRVGVAVATASLLFGSTIGLSGAALAATAAAAGTSGAAGSGQPDATSTGVSANAQVPSGAVMVVLADQLASTPASSAHVTQRRSLASSQQDQVLASAGISSQGVKHFTLVNGFATTVTPAQALKLSKDPRVKSIVPDATSTVPNPTSPTDPVTGTQNAAPTKKGLNNLKGVSPQSSTPAKPSTPSQQTCTSDPKKPMLEPEALSAIKANSTDGSDSAAKYATGKGVKVAVMAEGIDPSAPDYKRPDGTSAIVDYQNFSGAPEATVQYGDEIFGDASSIAAQGSVVHYLSKWVNIAHALPEGCNIKIKGVSPGASVVALNVVGGDGGDDATTPSYATASVVAQAIDYAVTVQHVDILSESIGANAIPDQSARNAVQQFNDAAVAQGVTVVASTGDAGVTGTLGDPAVDPLVIGAGATTTLRAYQQIGFAGTLFSKGTWLNGNISSFSSGGFGQSGNLPVLTAPGDTGWAACTDKTDKPGCTDLNGQPASMELFGGTSQSAPFIAGVSALVIQAYRDGHRGVAPSPAQVRQILTGTATDIGAPGQQQGAGQVDALAAVKLAKTFGNAKGAASNALLVKQDQVQVSGAPGQTVSKTVTVTNQSAKDAVIAPSVKSLQPISKPANVTTAIAADGPAFLNQGGVKTTYKTAKFTVPKGVDQYAFRFSYGAKGSEPSQPDYASVSMALISPSGQFAGNTRPQSGTSILGPSRYGRFDIVHPAAGQWTAVFMSAPSLKNEGGATPVPVPAYAGNIEYQATMNHWVNAGSVSAKKVTVKAHSSAAFSVSTKLPNASGDSTVTTFLGAPKGYSAPVIPVSQRVLVNLGAKGGSFSGTMTGGNGRGGAPAQQDTFAMNVPSGLDTMQVKMAFPDAYKTQVLRASLVDPNGMLQGAQSNVTLKHAGSGAYLSVDKPIPGQWRIVVTQVSVTFGRSVTSPYTGTVSFNDSGVGSSDLAAMKSSSPTLTTLPVGQQTPVTINLTNNSGVEANYVIDPRTATMEKIQYPAIKVSMPTPAGDLLGNLRVGPQTSRVDVTAVAPAAVQAQLTGPGALTGLGGMSAVGSASPLINGSSSSTASLSTRSGQMTMGPYGAAAGSVGPFGAEGAPHVQATITPTLYTAGFDRSVSTETGDIYLNELDGLAGGKLIEVAPGATVKVTALIDPRASLGSTVSGRINVVQFGNNGLSALIAPYVYANDMVVQSFDYHFKVGAAQNQIKGTVTGLDNVALPGVKVDAFDANNTLVQSQLSVADGSYALGGLTAGKPYRVCFDSSTLDSSLSYKPICYKDVTWDGTAVPAAATSVTAPAAGSPLTGIDANLPTSGNVTGVVTDPAGNPMPNVLVMYTDKAGALQAAQGVPTDASGSYTFKGLSSDPVICVFGGLSAPSTANPRGLITECGGQTWGLSPDLTGLPANASKVALKAGGSVSYNVQLRAGGTVTGTIKNPDGTPAAGASVVALDAKGGDYGPIGIYTDADGKYEVPGIAENAVTICAVMGQATTATCAPNKPYPGESGPPPAGSVYVTIPSGTTAAGPDFALLPASVVQPGAAAAAQAKKLEQSTPLAKAMDKLKAAAK